MHFSNLWPKWNEFLKLVTKITYIFIGLWPSLHGFPMFVTTFTYFSTVYSNLQCILKHVTKLACISQACDQTYPSKLISFSQACNQTYMHFPSLWPNLYAFPKLVTKHFPSLWSKLDAFSNLWPNLYAFPKLVTKLTCISQALDRIYMHFLGLGSNI